MSGPEPCPQCAEEGERQRQLDDAIAASLAAVQQLQRDLDAVSLALRSGARAPEQGGAKTLRRQHESPTCTSTRSSYGFSYDPQLSSRFRRECVPGVCYCRCRSSTHECVKQTLSE